MYDKIRSMIDRCGEIDRLLADPEVARNPSRSTALMKERAKLAKVADLAGELEKVRSEKAEAQGMASDPEMKGMAQEEIRTLTIREKDLIHHLEDLVLVSDRNSDRSAILEIRPGTGGEEAALFAAELLRMYQKYAEKRGWKLQTVDLAGTNLGGVKYANISIDGDEVYKYLRFESGTHRVQRVPRTEAAGRIHTSAATVAVLPQAEEVDVAINPKDLKIDTYSAGGPGGQHVNKTQSAVRITHLPTNIVVQCQNERSQIRNRDLAMRWLRSRLYDHLQREQNKQISDLRRTQVGSGDRSEKIRTYNYPQNRITDHRIKFSVHNLEEFLAGELDEMLAKLLEVDRDKKLQALSGKKSP